MYLSTIGNVEDRVGYSIHTSLIMAIWPRRLQYRQGDMWDAANKVFAVTKDQHGAPRVRRATSQMPTQAHPGMSGKKCSCRDFLIGSTAQSAGAEWRNRWVCMCMYSRGRVQGGGQAKQWFEFRGCDVGLACSQLVGQTLARLSRRRLYAGTTNPFCSA